LSPNLTADNAAAAEHVTPLTQPTVNVDVDDVATRVVKTIDAEFFANIVIPKLPRDQRYPLGGVANKFIRDLAALMLEGKAGEDDTWVALIYRWIELEERWQEFMFDSEALSTDLRPPVFKAWFKNGRTTKSTGRKTPKEVTLPGFRHMWWKWLGDILPETCSRDKAGTVAVPQDFSEAQSLECPGKDGLSLLLMGLKWWHERGAENDAEGVGGWEHAAKSMYLNMGLLLEGCRCRSPEPQDNPSSAPSRRKSPDTPSFEEPGAKRRRVSGKK
ncbi:hypothetical protein V5O48_018850, partial [Marasmius crinis-equi]